MIPVDLRSDTVTQPTPDMLEAMRAAPLGDDVLEGDPTIRALEAKVAALLGKQAAIFTPSGTMANLLALLAQTHRGDEVVTDDQSHVYYYEGAGYAGVAGLSMRFAPADRGIISGDAVRSVLRPTDQHFPTTRLVSIENTHNRAGGMPWTLAQVKEVAATARNHDLRIHMDGARLWNACAATGASPRDYAAHVDSISVCFSKGLGCPVGSALVADEETIAIARRRRKMLGGSMRQAGMLAAAAIHALDHNRARLTDDHRRAAMLARNLEGIPGLTVDRSRVVTNMVYFGIAPALGTAAQFCELIESEVRVLPTGPQTIRAVLHLHIDDDALERAAAAIISATEAINARA
jgi:threonine aldolase